MRWTGVYIPLLPSPMVEIMQSPVPFMLGVPAEARATYRHRTRASRIYNAPRLIPPMMSRS